MENELRGGEGCTRRSDDADQSSMGCSGEVQASSQDDAAKEKPYVGMVFESEEAARNYYEAHATRVGFSTCISNYSRAKLDGPIVSWEYTCSGEVLKRKNMGSCGALLKIDKQGEDCWVVTKFVENHNHSCPGEVDRLRSLKHFVGATKNVKDTSNNQNGITISLDGCNNGFNDPNIARITSPVEVNNMVRNVSSVEQVTVARNVYPVEMNRAPVNIPQAMPVYFVQPSTRRILGKDAQNLLTYLQKMQADNPGFYYAVQLNDQNRMTNVFWADARSRTAYEHFGDAVTFDTTYRPNQFKVPCAPFTGVNHHGQMVLFGCALLSDESEASFTWVFKTWLSAMNNKPPVSIITDHDRVIKAAVNRVFPRTRHCICKWHILREGRLSQLYLVHPPLYGELYSCISFSETVEDFESSWSSILEKYHLRKDEWLQAVYSARSMWASVYFRDTFFAALSLNHGVSSFFEGFVNQQTTLPMFFQHYERALENSLKREIDADFDTLCNTQVLKTLSPMEQQAADVYTKTVFAKFQEELVETFVYTANKIEGNGTVSKFRVAKYEHNDRAYIVTLDVSGMKARCSCQMFEYVGVLCRHILTVFTVTNVLTIPSHYILKRWTCNAKSGLSDELEFNIKSTDSLTLRFNNLCKEALKFAEDGAISSEAYTTCMEALCEGAKEVSAVKGNVAKSKPHSSKKSTSFADNGSTVSDLNYPTMAPVAINRDGSLADNTVVLTSFKLMTWVIENRNPKVAVINLKLQDYGKALSGETEVPFKLTKHALEPMLKSMAYISQQLSIPANRVAVINLKLHGTKTTNGETEVKFQVNKETLGSMLRSMTLIREQL